MFSVRKGGSFEEAAERQEKQTHFQQHLHTHQNVQESCCQTIILWALWRKCVIFLQQLLSNLHNNQQTGLSFLVLKSGSQNLLVFKPAVFFRRGKTDTWSEKMCLFARFFFHLSYCQWNLLWRSCWNCVAVLHLMHEGVPSYRQHRAVRQNYTSRSVNETTVITDVFFCDLPSAGLLCRSVCAFDSQTLQQVFILSVQQNLFAAFAALLQKGTRR